MTQLVGTFSSNLVSIYFGSLEFLDTQTTFDVIFGIEPVILDTQLASNNSVSYLEHIHVYADTYIMDVFLDICRDDYVGGVNNGSKKKLVYEICKSILDIRQDYTTPRNSKAMESPDKLYSRHIRVVAGLPHDVSLWLTTLCSS